jgi:hypothetical protein
MRKPDPRPARAKPGPKPANGQPLTAADRQRAFRERQAAEIRGWLLELRRYRELYGPLPPLGS